jgi:hypothetical protein
VAREVQNLKEAVKHKTRASVEVADDGKENKLARFRQIQLSNKLRRPSTPASQSSDNYGLEDSIMQP